ncbi:MAG: pilus assembly protein N-terminal domain-containing protein, partial [Parvibaculum sp.]|nr:pilus assembly protein N-terminal domain-containing protein [Parvibaculum sp.]
MRQTFDRSGAAISFALFTFLAVLLFSHAGALAADATLSIATGGQRILKLGQTVDRIAIADPAT